VTLVKSRNPLILAASAPAKQEKDGFSFEMKGGRGFALSLSPEYQLLEGKNGVRAYVFPEHIKAGQASLQAAQDAVSLFSNLYTPYPYPGLSIVEADFFDGMEYSGLFFLGADYFTAYPGGATSYLVPLSAHETSHQWWYSLVGDDPAMEPWLDESLAAYSELLYYQKYQPDLVDWWWGYRVRRFLPQGKVDSTIYDLQAFRPYVDAVYLRGVLFLDDLHKKIGDDAFSAFLKDYAARNAYRIAKRSNFFAILKSHTDKDLSDLIREYFKNP
jgi:aminopeptidase N